MSVRISIEWKPEILSLSLLAIDGLKIRDQRIDIVLRQRVRVLFHLWFVELCGTIFDFRRSHWTFLKTRP
jgi:hypothetical protein